MQRLRFHLAIPTHDLEASRHFYGEILGCSEGRSDPLWVDFCFFDHQLTTHVSPAPTTAKHSNRVDEHDVPVPHFGVILEPSQWEALAQRLRKLDCKFLIEPSTRFRGEVGEQSTFFIADPTGNILEFKSFGDSTRVFAR